MGTERNTQQYGKYYWCVGLEGGKEVYLYADRGQVLRCGGLLFVRLSVHGEELPLLAFASGQWVFFYAASVIDGVAVAVEHWAGQVAEG